MDPVTALGIAGNVCQLVDFGIKLLSSGIELHKSSSGTLKVNDELELIAAEIAALAGRLSADQGLGINFSKICDEAAKLSQEVVDRVLKLKVQGERQVWRSLKVAILAAWTKDELASLMGRLERLRQTVEATILVSVRDDFNMMSVKISERFNHLDEQTQRIILALLQHKGDNNDDLSGKLRDQTVAIAQMLSRMEVNNMNELRKIRGQIRRNDGIINTGTIVDLTEQDEDELRLVVETRLLDRLQFENMRTREDSVAEAHKKTFEWVFQETKTETPWSNFVEWLTDGRGVYWIKGKAGSGKSTLMRFISCDSRTKQYLQLWAGAVPLYFAHHYFWNSGTVDQRSQLGLLQTLLHEVLNEQPKLIPIVLPRLWAQTYSRAAMKRFPDLSLPITSWSLSELMDAFTLLVKQTILPVKLCLFIDGLDEFEGDHEAISELFKEVSTSPNVKVCLSSRPWRVFDVCFANCPSLKLQDLTFGDIEIYVRDKLHQNQTFQQLAEKEKEEAALLVTEITQRADGVFLWVRLVVKSLIQGLQNLDDLSDLKRRLHLLPTELKKLYATMFSLIEEVYHRKSSEIFQIFRVAQNKDGLLFADNHDDVLPLNFAINSERDIKGPLNLSEFDDIFIREKVEVQLAVYCAGLLEAWEYQVDSRGSPRFKVHYMHRTAREFIESPQTWGEIEQRTAGTDFDPNIAMLRSCLSRPDGVNPRRNAAIMKDAITFGSRSRLAHDSSCFNCLNHLDKLMLSDSTEEHWTNTLGYAQEPGVSGWISRYGSFYQFAIHNDIFNYVKYKIKESGVQQSKNERPLLEFTMTLQRGKIPKIFGVHLAKLLLDHGADPNFRYLRYSTWEKVLWMLYDLWTSEMIEHSLEVVNNVVAYFTAFVSHGADPNASIIYKDELLTALKIIRTTIYTSFPAEAEGLKRMIEGLGAKADLKWSRMFVKRLRRRKVDIMREFHDY